MCRLCEIYSSDHPWTEPVCQTNQTILLFSWQPGERFVYAQANVPKGLCHVTNTAALSPSCLPRLG